MRSSLAPRVLLISEAAPGTSSVGRLFLKQLCQYYPRGRICCVHMDAAAWRSPDTELDWLPQEYVTAPRETGLEIRGIQRLPWLHSLLYDALARPGVKRLLQRAVSFGRQKQVERVWLSVRTPSTVMVGLEAARRLGVPLFSLVWDPPAHVWRHFRLDRITQTRLLRRFDQTIAGSRRCAVASDIMKARYEQLYRVPCSVLIYGLHKAPTDGASSRRRRGDEVVVGVIGHLWALEEWRAFLAALAGSLWSVDGKAIRLRVMSSRVPPTFDIPFRMDYLGWLATERVLQELDRCDVAYVAFQSNPQHREVVEFSFPNKIATCVAAAIPILFHGPQRSSVADFLRRYPIGLCCHSNDPGELIGTVRTLATDRSVIVRARQACRRAYEEELGPHVFRRRFAEFMDIDEALLEVS